MKDITIKLNTEGLKSRRAAWTNGTLYGIFNNQVYDTCQLITNRYVYKLEVDGEIKELTRGQIMAYVQGSDPDLRAAGYLSSYSHMGRYYTLAEAAWRRLEAESFDSTTGP